MKTCVCVFRVVARQVLPRMRNVCDNSRSENQNTHFVFSIFFLIRFDYGIVCENVVQP